MVSQTGRRAFLSLLATGTIGGCLRLGSDDSAEDGTDTEAADNESEQSDTPSATPTVDDDDSTQVSTRLEVISSIGKDIQEQRVGTVSMTVGLSPGAADIDLSTLVVQWVDDSGVYDLTSADFDVVAIQDDNDSLSASPPVLDSTEDRASLIFDLQAFREAGLPEGASVDVKLVTEGGGETTVLLTVPQTLANAGEAVML